MAAVHHCTRAPMLSAAPSNLQSLQAFERGHAHPLIDGTVCEWVPDALGGFVTCCYFRSLFSRRGMSRLETLVSNHERYTHTHTHNPNPWGVGRPGVLSSFQSVACSQLGGLSLGVLHPPSVSLLVRCTRMMSHRTRWIPRKSWWQAFSLPHAIRTVVNGACTCGVFWATAQADATFNFWPLRLRIMFRVKACNCLPETCGTRRPLPPWRPCDLGGVRGCFGGPICVCERLYSNQDTISLPVVLNGIWALRSPSPPRLLILIPQILDQPLFVFCSRFFPVISAEAHTPLAIESAEPAVPSFLLICLRWLHRPSMHVQTCACRAHASRALVLFAPPVVGVTRCAYFSSYAIGPVFSRSLRLVGVEVRVLAWCFSSSHDFHQFGFGQS